VAACAGDVVRPATILLLTTVKGTSGKAAASAISVAVCGRNRSSAFRRGEPDNPFQHIVIGVVRREKDNADHLLREPPGVKIHEQPANRSTHQKVRR
jgi:hypothetical protein